MLAPFLSAVFGGRPLVIASNREPWIHVLQPDGNGVRAEQPASGLVSALEPLAEATGGTWIAHGGGSADRLVVDRSDAVAMPPSSPRYRLRRLWLSDEQLEGYYRQVANRGLWPLCHLAFVAPEFEPAHWRTYAEVNQRFAEAILEETPSEGGLVFLQDYHLALVPRLLKRARPNLTVVQFWHVPWPPSEQLRSCPYTAELIEGLLGNDLLGFQTGEHCRRFLAAVDQLGPPPEAKGLEAAGSVLPPGHVTRVGSFPISIDFDAWSTASSQPAVEAAMQRWRRELDLDGQRLGIGIDRLDYTKGLPQRLGGLDHLLETRPQWRGRLRFLQLLAPPRDGHELADSLRLKLEEQVAALNDRWRRGTWVPLQLVQQQRTAAELLALHRLARFCLVSSLDDGMNLVAKEFVASRSDGDGVLILSRYTGSARELDGALQVNPYDREALAQAIQDALEMEATLRRRRMARMRRQVSEHNVYRWAATLLAEAVQCQRHPQPPERLQRYEA